MPSQNRTPLTAFDYLLYVITVLSWSLSWYALKIQVGVVPVQVSLFWRFLLAAMIMLIWALIKGAPLRFPPKTHVKFLAMGACMFCLNFALFYYASQWIVSGLLSVVFSLASVFNIFLAIVFLELKPTGKMLFGATLGMAGIALMFWPEIAKQTFDQNALIGLGMCIGGTLFFCTGNLISSSLQKAKVSIVSASTWGMGYGALVSLALAIFKGDAFIFEWSISYIGSLLFLAIVSSVIAFAAYLTLLGRIGTDRAGYAAVMFPVIALLTSSALEGYQMTMLAGLGLGLVLLGNVFVLGKSRKSKAA